METKVVKIDKDNIDLADINKACEVLKKGGLVAFPTETVFGLGADALNADAARKIYEAKGRPSDNPLIVHAADKEVIDVLAKNVSKKAYKLADKFWPGPLTMIFEKKDIVPKGTTGGLDTVAIRVPNHKVALALLKESGVYVAAPSANSSGRPSPTLASHVYDDLNGKIDMILDSDGVGIGIESTILDMTSDIPVILRPGYITPDMLYEVIGEVAIDKAILAQNKDKNFVPKAPGMKYKHYAPKGDLTIIEGKRQIVINKINELVKIKQDIGKKVAVIATNETLNEYNCDVVKSLGSRKNKITISRNLYKVLRELDDLNIEYIYTEGDMEQAVMNRLLKAAAYKVITVNN